MSVYEVFDAGGIGGKRVLKNGSVINEFGLLNDIWKLESEVEELEDENQKLKLQYADFAESFLELIGGTSEPEGFDVVVNRHDYEAMLAKFEAITKDSNHE